jgi:hypothetical protein
MAFLVTLSLYADPLALCIRVQGGAVSLRPLHPHGRKGQGVPEKQKAFEISSDCVIEKSWASRTFTSTAG